MDKRTIRDANAECDTQYWRDVGNRYGVSKQGLNNLPGGKKGGSFLSIFFLLFTAQQCPVPAGIPEPSPSSLPPPGDYHRLNAEPLKQVGGGTWGGGDIGNV